MDQEVGFQPRQNKHRVNKGGAHLETYLVPTLQRGYA